MKANLIVIAMVSILIFGCSSRVKVASQIPAPLVNPIKLTIGAHYPKALREHKYIEEGDDRDDWTIEQGQAQVQMFNQVLGAMFEHMVELKEQKGPADLVLTPTIEEFQYTVPRETRGKIYEVWYKYHFQLHDGKGKLVADWYMTSYGKTPTAFAQTDSSGLDQAIEMALRDTGANLVFGFTRVPEIRQWLSDRNKNLGMAQTNKEESL